MRVEGESNSSTSSREIEDTSSADSQESLAGEGDRVLQHHNEKTRDAGGRRGKGRSSSYTSSK